MFELIFLYFPIVCYSYLYLLLIPWFYLQTAGGILLPDSGKKLNEGEVSIDNREQNIRWIISVLS